MITIIGNDNLDDVSNPAPVDTEEDDFEEGVALTVEELVFLAENLKYMIELRLTTILLMLTLRLRTMTSKRK